jgi:hypothetical protein
VLYIAARVVGLLIARPLFALHAVIEPKLLELGYCCGGKTRTFLPVPLACNGPRCPGLIGRDADYYEATVEPKADAAAKPVYRLCQPCYQAQQAKDTMDVVCDEVGIDGSEQYDAVPKAAFVAMKNDVNPPEPVCHPDHACTRRMHWALCASTLSTQTRMRIHPPCHYPSQLLPCVSCGMRVHPVCRLFNSKVTKRLYCERCEKAWGTDKDKVSYMRYSADKLGRSKLTDYLELRINKVINGEGPPVTVRMLYHGVKEFTLGDKLISKRCVVRAAAVASIPTACPSVVLTWAP